MHSCRRKSTFIFDVSGAHQNVIARGGYAATRASQDASCHLAPLKVSNESMMFAILYLVEGSFELRILLNDDR